MVRFYNIADIRLGKPTYSGHETYLNAVYTPPNSSAKPWKVVFKKNKYGKAKFSRFEIAFSQLAQLFCNAGTTSHQKLVVDDSLRVAGLITDHLCYVIEGKEGLAHAFFTLEDPTQHCNLNPKQVSQAEAIPYYFFNELPQGFFSKLLKAEEGNQLDIDYASLASILTSCYTLEEDDLHKGNFGFYIIRKNGRPRVVFFKIDHDLMLADSIISFKESRPSHLLHGPNAFDITAGDLLNFPNLSDSSNTYWPTKRNFGPWGNKLYLSFSETEAFSALANRPEFRRAKWMSFYKHILLTPTHIQECLKECLDDHEASDRARIALLSEAVIARQARLKSVLFSLKEFRDFIISLSPEEHSSLLDELLKSSPQLDISPTVMNHLLLDQELCQSQEIFEEGDTPLHTAIKLGDYRYEETIRMFGHFINVKNKAGKTPLDVALERLDKGQNPPADVRKDIRFTMKHLLENGAEPTKQFKLFNQREHIESYKFRTPYLSLVGQAKSYQDLKGILRDIGEDHTFCLKFKKNLAIECINYFIKVNENLPNMRGILFQLRKEMNGGAAKEACAPLLYIRRLRSKLWIIRLIRGLYGQTSTLVEINDLIDKQLQRLKSKEPGYFSFFCNTKTDDSKSPENENNRDLLPRQR